jgi:hypothetical protein
MGTLLAGNKSLPAIGADGYGNIHQAVNFPDVQITAWAKQFATYTADFDDFVGEVANYLSAQQPSALVLDNIVTILFPDNTSYEWTTMDDAAKVAKVRQLLNQLMSLVDYQLA